MADADEPDELDRQMERARKRMDSARADLMVLIDQSLAQGRSFARIGRWSHWSADYIKKLGKKRRR